MTRIAASQYPVEFLRDWPSFERKIESLVGEAAEAGAKLLVFPEYGGMELISLFPESLTIPGQLEKIQELRQDFIDLFSDLAGRHSVYIVSPTFPYNSGSLRFHNRAYLLSPGGRVEFQDKLMMTRFETERLGLTGGDEIKVFETSIGIIGIDICYDAELPQIARAQALSGAEIIVVPSCTDSLAGYHRVRIGCQARALENQCYVVQSVTVGSAPWTDILDINIGAAAFYAPPDIGFPDDGILKCGELNQPGWVYAELNTESIHRLRTDGQVLNFRDSKRLEPLEARVIGIG